MAALVSQGKVQHLGLSEASADTCAALRTPAPRPTSRTTTPNLFTRDIDAALAFYRDQVGFAES